MDLDLAVIEASEEPSFAFTLCARAKISLLDAFEVNILTWLLKLIKKIVSGGVFLFFFLLCCGGLGFGLLILILDRFFFYRLQLFSFLLFLVGAGEVIELPLDLLNAREGEMVFLQVLKLGDIVLDIEL